MVQNSGWMTGGQSGPGAGHDDPARWSPRLTRILDRQCELCHDLDALSGTQSELIVAGDTDGLLRLLAQRQALVDQLMKLSEESEPFRRKWETFMSRLPRAERERLDGRVAELKQLVERIGRRDDADCVALEHQRAAVSEQIGDLGRGRGAVAAYARRPAQTEARFQDRTG
jgi:flagellar biosynthesis/type III secretory pathway chaperone